MLSLYVLNLNPAVTEEKKKGFRKAERQKAAGRYLLEKALEQHFPQALENLAIGTKEGGKPYLLHQKSVFFNISHSGTYVVCGISDAEIGVDVECVKKNRLEVAKRFFHPAEWKILQDKKEEERNILFYRYWCAKESFLKYTGEGLKRSLASFRIVWNGKEGQVYEEEKLLPVVCREYDVAEGYICVICTEQKDPVQFFQVSEE